VLAAAVALTVALAGCGDGGTGDGGDAPDGAAPAVPAPPPDAGAAAYQARLDQLDRELAGAFAKVAQAREPDALAQATLEATGATAAAAERMRVPPGDPALERANSALSGGLDQFARELGYLTQRVNDHEVCTGPAAITIIATAPTMPALRAVSSGLAFPGPDGRTYRWGSSLPPVPKDLSAPPPQPANGAILVDHRPPNRGDGVLEARNEEENAAVVVLGQGGKALVSVAVAPGQSAFVGGIPDGEYQLAYTTGWDWDPGLGAFSRGCRFRRFTEPALFRTEPSAGGTGYTVQTVVIRSGPADAVTADIPARELPGA
jgi:hypothetical protein